MPSHPSKGIEKEEALEGEARLRYTVLQSSQPASQPGEERWPKMDDSWFLWSSGEEEKTRKITLDKSIRLKFQNLLFYRGYIWHITK